MKFWLAGPLRRRVREVLESPAGRSILTSHGRSLLTAEMTDRRRSYMRLWAPVVLIAWTEAHGCSL